MTLLSLVRSTLSLSVPLMIARMGVPLSALGIAWILAHVSEVALAAGALGNSLFMVMMTFLAGLLMSAVGTQVAYAAGERDPAEVTRILQQGIWLGVFLSLPFIFLLLNFATLLHWLGQESDVVCEAQEFARPLVFMFVPYVVIVNCYKLFTNLKKTYIPMAYGVMGLLLGIFLSTILALGKFGLPAMGIAGIAWGKVISYGVQASMLIFHVSISKKTQAYPIFTKWVGPHLLYLKKLWTIGWPIGVKYNIEYFLLFIIAAILGHSFPDELPVYQVIFGLFLISSIFSSSIGIGTQTLLGQAMGAQKTARYRSICYVGLGVSLSGLLLIGCLLWLFGSSFASLYFPVASFHYDLLLSVLTIVALFFFVDSSRRVLTDILVVFKFSRFPLLAEIMGLWLVGFPLSYLLGVWGGYGLLGFLIGLIGGVLVSVVIMAIKLGMVPYFQKSSNIDSVAGPRC